MKCMFCGCMESKVLDSRSNTEGDSIRRRRECLNCGKRYTTYEMVETNPMVVININNEREPFKLEKLVESLEHAFYCTDAYTSVATLALDIERELLALNQQEISTMDIVKISIAKIKELDELACLVYYTQHTDCKSLNDVRRFLGM